MTIAEQKLNLTKSLLNISDKKLLNEIDNIIDVHNRQKDFWNELNESVKKDIEEALIESEKGLGKKHSIVMKKYKKWL